jgi:hypothetical protein
LQELHESLSVASQFFRKMRGDHNVLPAGVAIIGFSRGEDVLFWLRVSLGRPLFMHIAWHETRNM